MSRLVLADLFVVDNSQGWGLPWGNTEQALGYTTAHSVQIQTLFLATTRFSLTLFQSATSSTYRCSRETFRSSAELDSKNKNVYANTNVMCPVNWSIKINLCGWPFVYTMGLRFRQKRLVLLPGPVFYHPTRTPTAQKGLLKSCGKKTVVAPYLMNKTGKIHLKTLLTGIEPATLPKFYTGWIAS